MPQTIQEIMEQNHNLTVGEAKKIRDDQAKAEHDEKLKPLREAAEKNARERSEAKAAEQLKKQQAHADRAEAKEKAEGLQAWLSSGGKREEFDAAWPELRAAMIRKRTLDKLTFVDAPRRIEL